jgi:hypothetical protein
MQAGLVDYWDVWFRPMPPQCQENIQTNKPINRKSLEMHDKKPALTLTNLTGAFIVLLFGFSLSFLVFLCEQIIEFPRRRSRQLRKTRSNANNFTEITQDRPRVLAE